MRWFVLLLLSSGCETIFPLVLPGSLPDATSGPCPSEFNGGAYLHVTLQTLEWRNAQVACAAMDPDPDDDVFVHLAVIHASTPTEVDAEVSRWGLRPGDDAWIGLTDRRLNMSGSPPPLPANFEWITQDGTANADIPWSLGEPETSSDPPYCGTIQLEDFRIDDLRCAALRSYVCQCDGFKPDATITDI